MTGEPHAEGVISNSFYFGHSALVCVVGGGSAWYVCMYFPTGRVGWQDEG